MAEAGETGTEEAAAAEAAAEAAAAEMAAAAKTDEDAAAALKKKNGEGDGGDGGDPAAWRVGISDPDEIKNAERFESPADINRAHMDLRKRNSAMIPLIDDKSSEEDVAKFRKQIGAKENPEAYAKSVDWTELGKDYEPTDIDKAYVGAMSEVAAAQGLPVSVFSGMAAAHNKMQAEINAEAIKAIEVSVKKMDDELRVEWGPDYERNKGAGEASKVLVAKQIGVDVQDINDILNAELKHADVQFGNTATAQKLFSWLGHRLSEGGAIGTTESQGRVESIDEEIKGIEEKLAEGPVPKADMARRKQLIEEKDKLLGIAE